MFYLGIMLGVGILAAMIYMALNKKSNFHVRIASIAAIFLMVLTIIICLFIVFTDNAIPEDESVLIVGAVPEVPEVDTTNNMVLTLLIMFLVVFFIIVAFFSMREHRKNFPKKN